MMLKGSLPSMSLRDHAERSLGFNQVTDAPTQRFRNMKARLRPDGGVANPRDTSAYPHLQLLLPLEGKDDSATTAELPVAHKPMPHPRQTLGVGTADAALSLEAARDNRSALHLALAHRIGEPVMADQPRIRIDVFLRDDLP
jgi:LacI family transcriptional regulator